MFFLTNGPEAPADGLCTVKKIPYLITPSQIVSGLQAETNSLRRDIYCIFS